ncbi:protein of unknown function [Vibrio tapetis subsp. tapetis]|uniref:Uncharacterized protein n=1 Tax=Vibrio tapetis subsp. tapetis TaxID=1671868 RepID=A0A2N8ZHU2_9VIBR|nr:protein of unknown function [Vibrio tapetis subsp. tapetis]
MIRLVTAITSFVKTTNNGSYFISIPYFWLLFKQVLKPSRQTHFHTLLDYDGHSFSKNDRFLVYKYPS